MMMMEMYVGSIARNDASVRYGSRESKDPRMRHGGAAARFSFSSFLSMSSSFFS